MAMYPPPGPAPVRSPDQLFSFDDDALQTRIAHVVADKLPNAHPDNIALLVSHICRALVRMKKVGELGPWGITGTDDVFLGVGYEGMSCYMGLMVNAPGAGVVRCFFWGELMGRDNMEKMAPEQRLKELESRFVSALMRLFDQIRDAKLAQGRL